MGETRFTILESKKSKTAVAAVFSITFYMLISGLVLFAFIMFINTVLTRIFQKGGAEHD